MAGLGAGKAGPLALVACVFWLVYWRRRIVSARVLLVLTACVTVLFFMVLPMGLLPWGTSTHCALHAAKGQGGRGYCDRISLRNPRVCFPAARFADLATDAAFVAGTQRNGLRLWSERGACGSLARIPSPSSPASKCAACRSTGG